MWQPSAPRLLPVVDVGGKGGFGTGVLEGCVSVFFFSFWWVDTRDIHTCYIRRASTHGNMMICGFVTRPGNKRTVDGTPRPHRKLCWRCICLDANHDPTRGAGRTPAKQSTSCEYGNSLIQSPKSDGPGHKGPPLPPSGPAKHLPFG